MSNRTTLTPLLCALALVLAACGGDPETEGPDAAVTVDADSSALCTGAVYDSCADTAASSDCGPDLSCHVFDMAGITVCVPACDAQNPCPQQGGVDIRCNNMGRCRPDVANACTLP